MANRMASAIANRMANPMASTWQTDAPNPNPNPNPASACACLSCLSLVKEIIIVKAITRERLIQSDDDSLINKSKGAEK